MPNYLLYSPEVENHSAGTNRKTFGKIVELMSKGTANVREKNREERSHFPWQDSGCFSRGRLTVSSGLPAQLGAGVVRASGHVRGAGSAGSRSWRGLQTTPR